MQKLNQVLNKTENLLSNPQEIFQRTQKVGKVLILVYLLNPSGENCPKGLK